MSSVFERVLPTLRSMRTWIICDKPFVRDLILFQVILPHFSNGDVTVVIYSEALYRKFVKFVENTLKVSPELKDFVREVNVVKVGKSLDCKFGRLVSFIEQGNPIEEANGIINSFEKIGNDDILILHSSVGFLFELLGKDNTREILEIFSSIPFDTTLIGFKSGEKKVAPLMNELYDIIVRVEQDCMVDDYVVSVEFTFANGKMEFGRFKVKNGKITEEV